jgi:hypothetical protein
LGNPNATYLNGFGIWLWDISGATVDHCVIHDNGSQAEDNVNGVHNGAVGLMASQANAMVFQYNESYHNSTANSIDGEGIDFDGGVTNSVMQYNYTHDNYGAGLLSWQFAGATPKYGNTIRYNFSQNDGWGVPSFWGGLLVGKDSSATYENNLNVYNNTIFESSHGGDYAAVLGGVTNSDFRNNILLTTDGRQPYQNGGATFQGNDVWTMDNPGNPLNTMDPQLSSLEQNPEGAAVTLGNNNASLISTLTAPRPQPSSLVIDQGINLVNLGINPGPNDLEGDATLANGVNDIGCYEHPPAQAMFSFEDTSTQGTWHGVFGQDGSAIAGAPGAPSQTYTPGGSFNSFTPPSYLRVSGSLITRANTWTSVGEGQTTDVRALQQVTGSNRLVAWWFGPSFTVDINLTDGQAHQVALYFLDWGTNGQGYGASETVTVRDASSGAVLGSPLTLSSFNGGKYEVWNVTGHVRITVTNPSNGILNGVFFDPVEQHLVQPGSVVLGSLRNPANFTGYVGMQFTTGDSPEWVTRLGRWVAPGNNEYHTLGLIDATTLQWLPGGSVTLNLAGKTPGYFAYASLPAPVKLNANTSYLLVSSETYGGDTWYDWNSQVTPNSSVAQSFDKLVYWYSGGGWTMSPASNLCFGPLDLIDPPHVTEHAAVKLSPAQLTPTVGVVAIANTAPPPPSRISVPASSLGPTGAAPLPAHEVRAGRRHRVTRITITRRKAIILDRSRTSGGTYIP